MVSLLKGNFKAYKQDLVFSFVAGLYRWTPLKKTKILTRSRKEHQETEMVIQNNSTKGVRNSLKIFANSCDVILFSVDS